MNLLNKFKVDYIETKREMFSKTRDKVTRIVRDNPNSDFQAPSKINFRDELLEKGDVFTAMYIVSSNGDKRGGIGRKL